MDLGKAILWFSVALVSSGTVGYIFGFWEAQPAIKPLAIVGVVAATVAAIILVAVARTFLRPRSLQVSLNRLSLGTRVSLLWSGVAIVAAINISAFIGFTIGFRTAQSVVDILSGAGVVATLVGSAAVLIGIVSMRFYRDRSRDYVRR